MAVEPEARRRAHQWLDEVYAQQSEREALFETLSGEPVKPLYGPEDGAERDHEREIGLPGEYPFTR
ncbi:MAG: methylmalonyl-CoA mutase, N-terminal domain, partial [Solirubrobacterales bacterium]|nr:methylmalonyl-CoA mutase, N-terminal domain [Solirubrobacterales bacterium]